MGGAPHWVGFASLPAGVSSSWGPLSVWMIPLAPPWLFPVLSALPFLLLTVSAVSAVV